MSINFLKKLISFPMFLENNVMTQFKVSLTFRINTKVLNTYRRKCFKQKQANLKNISRKRLYWQWKSIFWITFSLWFITIPLEKKLCSPFWWVLIQFLSVLLDILSCMTTVKLRSAALYSTKKLFWLGLRNIIA